MAQRSVFYTSMGVLALTVVFVGFSRSYYLSHWMTPPPGMRPLTTTLHVHGLVFTAWFLLLAAQPMLIAGGSRTLHRHLGYAGAMLAVLMVVRFLRLPLSATPAWLAFTDFMTGLW